MKNKIQIIDTLGKVLFEYEKENNTLKDTLIEANLRWANLYGANLYGVNLYGANLRGADLREADLYGANLNKDTKIDTESLAFAETRFLPEGDIIGYKKCRNNVIVKLLIPKEAKRSHAFGRKCRAEYAQVLGIFGDGTATSQHDSNFTYEVGDTVRPTTTFSEDWFNECESGIHFFITRIEAENY